VFLLVLLLVRTCATGGPVDCLSRKRDCAFPVNNTAARTVIRLGQASKARRIASICSHASLSFY
jgi:hypothetical protein